MQTMTEREALEAYREMLNECYGNIEIAGLEYTTALALEQVDEIAFRCGFNDWTDAEGIEIE
jgi:hypothetical protein